MGPLSIIIHSKNVWIQPKHHCFGSSIVKFHFSIVEAPQFVNSPLPSELGVQMYEVSSHYASVTKKYFAKHLWPVCIRFGFYPGRLRLK